MHAKQILAVGLAIGCVILAIAGYKIITLPSKVADYAQKDVQQAGQHLDETINKCIEVVKSWGQPVDLSRSQNDCMEVKPIAEFAFSKIRVRSVLNYQLESSLSTKEVIADQAFDIRMGWASADRLEFIVITNEGLNTIRIMAPPPHKLTITPVEQTPEILYRADGLVNKLTLEDGIELERRLENQALASSDWQEGRTVAKREFMTYFQSLFELQGMKVEFHFTDGPDERPLIPLSNTVKN